LLYTDLWYISYRVPNTLRATYFLSPDDSLRPYQEEDDWEARHANWRADPLNPHVFVMPRDEDNPESRETIWSILEMPAAPPQPWLVPQQNQLAGTVTRHDFHSTLLANDWRMWIYTPPGYPDSAAAYHLLLLFDGWTYLNMLQVPRTIDTLLAAGSIPPSITVFIDSPDRNAEFTCAPTFVDFLTQELLPWVRTHYQVTSDPQQTIIGGASFGGLAALYAGIERPNDFGGVLSQSGAFWWSPADDLEHEWLLQHIQMLERVTLRVYLEAGTLETVAAQKVPSLVDTNRRIRDSLQNCSRCAPGSTLAASVAAFDCTANTSGMRGASIWKRCIGKGKATGSMRFPNIQQIKRSCVISASIRWALRTITSSITEATCWSCCTALILNGFLQRNA